MESSEFREVAALNQRIRRVLSAFRTVASHMGAHAGKSGEAALHLSGRIGAIGRAVLVPVSFGGMDLELLVRDELLLQAAAPQQAATQRGAFGQAVPADADEAPANRAERRAQSKKR